MPHTPLQIKDASVTLATEQHGDAITSVSCVPAITRTDWLPVSGNDQVEYSDPSWLLNIDLGQDYASSSLLTALVKGHGTTVPFEVKPKTGGQASITGQVRLAMPSQLLGGRAGVATAQASLSVQGQPTITDDAGVQIWPRVEDDPEA